MFCVFLSSKCIIRKPPGIVIGFVYSPTFNFDISFLIISDNWDSLIHPTWPPSFAESETLYRLAVFLKPDSEILFSINLYFF